MYARVALVSLAAVGVACGGASPSAQPTARTSELPPALTCDAARGVPSIDPGATQLALTLSHGVPGPVGLARAASVWTGREHLIFAGEHPETPSAPGERDANMHAVWADSPAGTAWTTIGYAVDPTTLVWRTLAGPALPGSAPSDAVAWLCGRAFVLTASGAGYLYDPDDGEVRTTSTAGAPVGCRGRPIHVDGSRAMIFGCDACEGHVYDATSDTWSSMGEGGDPIPWTTGRCATTYTGIVDGTFVVLRNYRDNAGARWDPRTRRWEAIAEDGSPQLVLAGPVGSDGVVWVVGQNEQPGVYRYDLRARVWSHTDLAGGVACMGTHAARAGRFFVEAGAWMSVAPVCAYDLERGVPSVHLTPGWNDPATVVSFGEDHVLFWGSVRGTDEGDGEMPLVPTRWIENDLRVVRYVASP